MFVLRKRGVLAGGRQAREGREGTGEKTGEVIETLRGFEVIKSDSLNLTALFRKYEIS